MLGGTDGKTRNDVWSSTDGETWTQVDAAAEWKARGGYTSVVFNGKIWVMGGYNVLNEESIESFNDVWSSPDGSNWTQVDAAADWKARWGHTSVVFDSKIWVMGGYDGTEYFNDVWSSPDGSNWTQVDAAADWKARERHTSVVFPPDGAGKKIWVMGGYDVDFNRLNDVWSSDNGQTWGKGTGLTNTVAYARTVEYKGRLWILDENNGFLSSADPATGWTAKIPCQTQLVKPRLWYSKTGYGCWEENTAEAEPTRSGKWALVPNSRFGPAQPGLALRFILMSRSLQSCSG